MNLTEVEVVDLGEKVVSKLAELTKQDKLFWSPLYSTVHIAEVGQWKIYVRLEVGGEPVVVIGTGDLFVRCRGERRHDGRSLVRAIEDQFDRLMPKAAEEFKRPFLAYSEEPKKVTGAMIVFLKELKSR